MKFPFSLALIDQYFSLRQLNRWSVMLTGDDIDCRYQFLTAKQAAARLGIKVETLYAYVSRGLVERSRGSGVHESRFLAADIETLRIKRSFGKSSGGFNLTLKSGTTEIADGKLYYRGRSAIDLASASSFETVAELLWSGSHQSSLEWHISEIELAIAERSADFLPKSASPMDRVQSLMLAMSAFDRPSGEFHREIALAKARRVIMLVARLIASRTSDSTALSDFLSSRRPNVVKLLYEGRLSHMEDPTLGDILNMILILSIDHDFSAPTLAVRIAASGRTTIYNCLLSGLSSLCGSSYLQSVEAVIQMLQSIEGSKPPLNLSEPWLCRYDVRQSLGHRLYPAGDPRARVVLDHLLSRSSSSARKTTLVRVIDAIRRVHLPPPNLSFALAAFSYLGDLDDGVAVALFGLARLGGWVAHFLEEHDEPPGRFASQSIYFTSA